MLLVAIFTSVSRTGPDREVGHSPWLQGNIRIIKSSTQLQISSSDLQYLFNVRTGINVSCENGDGDSCRGRGGGPGSPPDLALRKHFVLVRMHKQFAHT